MVRPGASSMKHLLVHVGAAASVLVLSVVAWGAIPPDDPLPSSNSSASKQAILDVVGRVTRQGGPEFVPVAERIAVFDNDGTLWSEQPIYVQVAFALDRVKKLMPSHPEWKDRQPFKAVLENDMKTVAAGGEKGILDILAATHVGSTTAEFELGRRFREARVDDVEHGSPSRGDRPYHTDAAREAAYDRESRIGTPARGLDETAARHWIVVDMQKDWKAIFPPTAPR